MLTPYEKYMARMARNTARNLEQARRKANLVKRARQSEAERAVVLDRIQRLGALTWVADPKALEREKKRKAKETSHALALAKIEGIAMARRAERKRHSLRF